MIRGIDVSQYQDTTPDLTGLSFLFARASIAGLGDTRYSLHTTNARRAGLIDGAYHFAYNNVSIATQVATFIHYAPDAALYAVDIEGQYAPSIAQTRDFINRMHGAGKKCGLYHSASGFFDAGQDFDWVAKWTTTPPTHWTFWQYRGSPLDLDYFNGSLADLRTLVSGAPVMPDTSTAGGTVDSFIAGDSNQTIGVNAGGKVYATSDLTGTPIIVNPARSFDYIGSFAGGARIIEWQPAPGAPDTFPIRGGYTGYVARSDAGSPVAKPDPTPYSQAELDAARASGGAVNQAALTQAKADERARIAAAEAARIEGI